MLLSGSNQLEKKSQNLLIYLTDKYSDGIKKNAYYIATRLYLYSVNLVRKLINKIFYSCNLRTTTRIYICFKKHSTGEYVNF